IMGNSTEYLKAATTDPNKKMIELSKRIPRLVYDLRYSTANNFMKREMYTPPTMVSFLRAPVAEALAKVQEELAASGLGLKIFDAYRPYSVTVKFWELVKDERYVANPARGSGHNRGIAVDLTLIKLSDNSEVPMGTGFDNFSDTAHHSFKALPENILQNRKLLRTTMEKYGFKTLETEWWHYFMPEGNRFEVLDIPFEKLHQLSMTKY
ncbi:MAG: M15 family metallopeptidase, partial [Chitinophagaceae bacterium]|nr:M15 family metallopeptidase [Chitinophagaceae bacterium]